MRRIRLLVIFGSLVGVSTFLLLQAFGITGIGIIKEFRTISIGWHSGIQSSKYLVIRSNKDWTQLWADHIRYMQNASLLPPVGFSKTMTIAVFTDSTRGYIVEIKKIVDTGLSAVVTVEQTPSWVRTIMNPYHMVQVDKLDRWVFFNTVTKESFP